jgi:hypothetical protein
MANVIFVMLRDDGFDGEWGLGWIRLLFFLFRERVRLFLKLAFTFPGLFDEGIKVH